MSNFTKQKATIDYPRTIVMFSFPKVGKTEALSQLPNNLIWDFDDSAAYYDNIRASFDKSTLQNYFDSFIKNYQNALEDVKQNGKFKFCTIDTITAAYEELANMLAVREYNSVENKNLALDYDITRLAYGLGYSYKRDSIKKLISSIQNLCDVLIITGHIGDKSINKETGSIDVADIDLEGKMKNILAYKVDAIGVFYRSSTNENSIKFQHNNLIAAGTRAKHLSGETIKVSEMKNKKLITFWENIFPHLKK